MLKTVLILKPWRCFSGEEVIQFRPGVNLLVGDQGTGKSSLFEAIQLRGMKKPKSLHLPPADTVPVVIDFQGDAVPVFAFDFERDNYRTKAFFEDDILFHVETMRRSHGEMVLAMLQRLELIDKKMLVLFDEPDMALSIKSCRRLTRCFNHVADLGGQVIATAHNPIVILSYEHVYSVEHGKWLSGKEYVDLQMAEDLPLLGTPAKPSPEKPPKKPSKKKRH
jgi:predicted ATPase